MTDAKEMLALADEMQALGFCEFDDSLSIDAYNTIIKALRLAAQSAPRDEVREALHHADVDLSMLLPEIANRDMQKSVRQTLALIDKARATLGSVPSTNNTSGGER